MSDPSDDDMLGALDLILVLQQQVRTRQDEPTSCPTVSEPRHPGVRCDRHMTAC